MNHHRQCIKSSETHRYRVRINTIKTPAFLVGFLFLFGCSATIRTAPPIGAFDGLSVLVHGRLHYTGNPDYLPRTVSGVAGNTNIEINYVYAVKYGRDAMPQAIPLFNPLTGLGFPIGENTLVVTGRLQVLRDGGLIGNYEAACTAEQTRTIFSEGETFSELRRSCLMEIRSSLESQMLSDTGLRSRAAPR